MTETRMAASSIEQTDSPQEKASVVACGHCRRRLAQEFFFTCRKCAASYCYIHMSRHQPAACSRQTRRNEREEAAETNDSGVKAELAKGEVPLVLAGQQRGFGSSANV